MQADKQSFPPVADVAGLSVLVLGAGAGVGPAVVRGFEANGARVHASDLTAEGQGGSRVPPHAVDDASAIAAFLDGCEAANGPLDVVAYVSPPVSVGKALDLEHEVYGRVLRDELLLPILLLREAARRMAGRGYGRLLSFCSMSGKTGVHPGVSPYAAAKGG